MKKIHLLVLISAFLLSLNFICQAQVDSNQGTLKNPNLSGSLENGVRVIELTAAKYKFSPDPIVVKLGEKVRIKATSLDVQHGLAIPEFDVDLTINPHKTSSVEFVADKEGTFHAHCSVYCGSGHMDMHASLIVVK